MIGCLIEVFLFIIGVLLVSAPFLLVVGNPNLPGQVEAQGDPITAMLIAFLLVVIVTGLLDILKRKHMMKNAELPRLIRKNAQLESQRAHLNTEAENSEKAERELWKQCLSDYRQNGRSQLIQAGQHMRVVRKNKLCELLALSGSEKAARLIVMKNGQNVRKEEEKLLADYAEMRALAESEGAEA